MNIITVILFVVALVLFVICTIGVPSPPRFNLMAAGLAFVVLAILATSVHAQPTPQSREDAYREQRAAERYGPWVDEGARQRSLERREARIEHRKMERWCEEQREKVMMHPRLVLPRECWRR